MLRTVIVKLALVSSLLLGCSTNKPYTIKSAKPNLSVKIHMEDPDFLQRQFAELHVYEVLGPCEWHYLGTIELKVGDQKVSLPSDKTIVIQLARANVSYSYESQSSHYFRFRPQTGKHYRLTSRERGSSREVLFAAGDAGGSYSPFQGEPLQKCQKMKIKE